MAWEQYQQQADGPGAQEDERRRRQQQAPQPAAAPQVQSPQLNQALALSKPAPGTPPQIQRPNPASVRPQAQGSPWALYGQAQAQPLVQGAQAPAPGAPPAAPQVRPMGLSTQAQPLVGAAPAGPSMPGLPAGWTPPDNMFSNPKQDFTGGINIGNLPPGSEKILNPFLNSQNPPSQTNPGGGGSQTPEQQAAALADELARREKLDGGSRTTLPLKENEKVIWTPDQFNANPAAFNFDQYQQWSDQYKNMAQDAGEKAGQTWQDQAAVRGVQDDLMAGAAGRQPGMDRAADESRSRLNATQGYVAGLASGAQDTAGGVGQKSIQQMSLDAAAGNGPTAAGAQFQRATDANIAAVRSAMAGQRGMSAGQAARMGGQQVADLGLKAAQDSAMLRAQEQQAAMGLAGNVTGQARGQDLQAAGLSSQLALGAQKQLADQAGSNLTASGNLAEQIRSADTGLYAGSMNQQNAAVGAGVGLDQQQLALKQAKEEYDYNRYRDWQNWQVTQYGGAGNYQTPWSEQALAGAAAGAAQGTVEGLINWGTK